MRESSRCLISRLDGAIHLLEWKDTLRDKFVMAAPRPRTLSDLHSAIASFDRGAEPETGINPKTVAKWRNRQTVEDRTFHCPTVI